MFPTFLEEVLDHHLTIVSPSYILKRPFKPQLTDATWLANNYNKCQHIEKNPNRLPSHRLRPGIHMLYIIFILADVQKQQKDSRVRRCVFGSR